MDTVASYLKDLELLDLNTVEGCHEWSKRVTIARRISGLDRVTPYGALLIEQNEDESWDIYLVAETSVIRLHTASETSEAEIELRPHNAQGYQQAQKIIEYLWNISTWSFLGPFVEALRSAIPSWRELVTAHQA